MKIARESADGEKLTQAALAKAAGISQTTVADIERGRNDGSKHIVTLARALKCSIDWLEKGDGSMRPSASASGFSDAESRIIECYRAATEEQRSLLSRIAENFVTPANQHQDEKIDLCQRKTG